MKTKTSKSASKKSAKATGTNPCLCGCGTKVKNNFAQGHDARLKGMLLRGEVRNPTADQRGFAKAHGVKIGSKAKKAA